MPGRGGGFFDKSQRLLHAEVGQEQLTEGSVPLDRKRLRAVVETDLHAPAEVAGCLGFRKLHVHQKHVLQRSQSPSVPGVRRHQAAAQS